MKSSGTGEHVVLRWAEISVFLQPGGFSLHDQVWAAPLSTSSDPGRLPRALDNDSSQTCAHTRAALTQEGLGGGGAPHLAAVPSDPRARSEHRGGSIRKSPSIGVIY